jgi:hypothetical protein
VQVDQPGAIGVTVNGYLCANCMTWSCRIARHSLLLSL